MSVTYHWHTDLDTRKSFVVLGRPGPCCDDFADWKELRAANR